MNFLTQLWSSAVPQEAEQTLEHLSQAVMGGDPIDKITLLTRQLMDWGVDLGGRILAAVLIFLLGRVVISLLLKGVVRLMERRKVDPSIQGFVRSLVSILLMVLLVVAVVGKLGIETTSFAALLASAGVAVGMALSGNLQNFAGGIIVLLFKPYRVGDYVEVTAQGVEGTVREIQIFHTILATSDNKLIYIPNSLTSSGVVINFSKQATRRVEWTVGVDYGQDYETVKRELEALAAGEKRFLAEPAPMVVLQQLADSNVNIMLRAWVNAADYWDVYYDINRVIYEQFNAVGIEFAYPQMVIHRPQ